MIKYIPIPREKNITTTNYNREHSLFMCEEGEVGGKDLKRGTESEILSGLKINFWKYL